MIIFHITLILKKYITCSNRPDQVAELAEHWASIPKVVGLIPTVVRHIFAASPVWIELRVTPQTSFLPRYNGTPRCNYENHDYNNTGMIK